MASSGYGGSGGGYYGSGYGQGHPSAAEEVPADESGLTAADQADIEAAMREGTYANSMGYFSQNGRWIGTSTETVSVPPDGVPRLPSDPGQIWTHEWRTEDISPHRRAATARTNYRDQFGEAPPPRAFAHYGGPDDDGLSTYDYRRLDGTPADARDVGARERNADRWASESLDRHTVPRNSWSIESHRRGEAAHAEEQARLQEQNQHRINAAAGRGGYLPPVVHQPNPPQDPPQDQHRRRRRRHH